MKTYQAEKIDIYILKEYFENYCAKEEKTYFESLEKLCKYIKKELGIIPKISNNYVTNIHEIKRDDERSQDLRELVIDKITGFKIKNKIYKEILNHK